MLSGDTTRIRCEADLSRSNEFQDRMTKTFGLSHWHKNVMLNDACFLKIDVYKARRKDYVTVEFSAQKYQNGNHVSPLCFDGVPTMLDDISAKVKEVTGIEIDLSAGTVTRCDFNYNWKLESELEVCSWLDVLQNVKYPYLKRDSLEGTAYFRSSAYAKNIYCGRPQSERIHEALFYAKSPQIKKLIERKQISKEDLLEVTNTLRFEERFRSENKIKQELKRHGFLSGIMTRPKPLTVLSADFAEEVIMKSYKDLHLEKDVLGKNERAVALLRHFAPNGKIEDRATRENFNRLYLTMKLADDIGGDNLLENGILTDSPFYRNKSELYDLGLWSSKPRKGREKRQVLKGLEKPIKRRSAE